MPDWSYRTVLRPLMLAIGCERSSRLAIATLSTLSKSTGGLKAIDFLGHMRADPALRCRVADADLASPIVLAPVIDPRGKALPAFSRFGAGALELGPVAERDVDEVLANIARLSPDVPLFVRLAEASPESMRRVAARFEDRASGFVVDAPDAVLKDQARPVFVRVSADNVPSTLLANGVWLHGDFASTLAAVKAVRSKFGPELVVIAGGVTAPDHVRQLRAAGADLVAVDAGLVISGPGLIKRCNEALLSESRKATPLEPLTLDAARRSWFWAVLLGASMTGGGLLALAIASTRVVLPYDESLCGMTRAELMRINPRLLPFMAHDRVSLAGTMISLGILYAALGWSGIRRGAHWAQVTMVASTCVGLLTFFAFLGFGYFDPFHAFVTAVLTQFSLLCLVMQPSPPQPPLGEWVETAEWRRGQWGQLLFIILGVGLTGAGTVMSTIACFFGVFVRTDLEFMQTTAAQLRTSYETLVPLVAHDRATLGGMLIANGIAIWLSAQWGFRAGARWLWIALAWSGNIAFICALTVHFVVGYDAMLHLAPAFAGWILWNVALMLSHGWLAAANRISVTPQSAPATKPV